MTDNSKCVKCNVFLRKVPGFKKIVSTEDEAKDIMRKIAREVKVNDILCNKCRLIINKIQRTETSIQPSTSNEKNTSQQESAEHLSQSFSFLSTSATTSSQSSTNDPSYIGAAKPAQEIEHVEMMFPRVISSHKYYCVYGSKSGITVVPFEARVQAFVRKRIFIPNGNRCCKSHIIKKRFYEEDIRDLRIHSNTSTFEIPDLEKLMTQLTISSDSMILDKIGEYAFPEERLTILTGLSWENILKLRDMMTSMRNTESRNVIQAIVVFLFKLRTGNSNRVIASVLGLEREQSVSEYSDSVINSFEKDILPMHFGVNAISRDTIMNHSSVTATNLYGSRDQLMIICDGTYIRHQKSSNNEYQRKSYSGQKKVPLCKPFTVCTTDGYVIDMLGPYEANLNDAAIMKIVMSDPNGLIKLLKTGDMFVVDRGFRDVKEYLEELGFQVLMPALKGKRSQLTTTESNESRFVTKVRWVVEAVHGILKQKYRVLDHKLDNKLLSKVRSYCRIVCFLNNEYGKRLDSDKDLSEEVVSLMKSRKDQDNSLANEVEISRWARRKVPFTSIKSDDLLDFPEMTEKGLKILFTGSYQFSQAVSYLAEIMDDNNNINLRYVKTNEKILKIEVRSRHIKAKTYRCFIDYRPNVIGISGIRRYSCECANGRRTVGCCSHVAAIIYYLSHARYLAKIIRPAEILSRLFTADGNIVVIQEDSDED
ncbi:uncharacterized protein [Venturia canescens]|uniref:uncharacterized protein n=1 Tax=Venturia canescens TaxID=32260 RepID=UPI001C9C363D|nr:uncharacterized protein LOC122417778 [Venturia canescens]